jgi:polyhydroxyalkanoate synthase
MTDETDKTSPASGASDLGAQAAEQVLGPNPFIGLRPVDVLATLKSLGDAAFKSPGLVWRYDTNLVASLLKIMSGKSELGAPKEDRRFADPIWLENPLYRGILQVYQAWNTAMGEFIDGTALDNASKERARFVVSLLSDAVSPTNMLLGNPAALRKAVDTRGKSLVDGMRNMINDITNNGGMPSQVDKTAFEPGRNLALTPGAVIWSNEVLELIQYEPQTKDVYARPQLIVPPQINKYYVFDLAPGKSIIEFLVKNGLQVFTVSWRNPVAEHRNWNMDTYASALLQAIDVVRDITGVEDVNLHGACSGAVTLVGLLGHLAAKRRRLVHAVTLMVAVLDTEAESLLGLFATKESIAAAKAASGLHGVLEGSEMGRVFAWMRPNDLVWNYWVNNYLMGNPPPVFDVLYWSNDSTRLPAAFHAQLLDIFADRQLQRPGAFKVLDTPVDLGMIDLDKFVVAGVTDHITPWKGVYNSMRLFGGKAEFVLSSSGHIQSLVNPPSNLKAKYFTGGKFLETPDAWLAAAKQQSGTWWEMWSKWIIERSGDLRPAPTSLGNLKYKPGVKAPGTYIR